MWQKNFKGPENLLSKSDSHYEWCGPPRTNYFNSFSYFTWDISGGFSVLFWFYWFCVNGAQWGKRWCHVLASTNQSLTNIQIKLTAGELLLILKAQSVKSDSTHTHTVLMKHISWAFKLLINNI